METLETSAGNITVLYEDRNVISFVKPFGILSQKAENSEENSILELLEASQKNIKLFPVHRLDRTTGGVMIAAKTKEAAAILSTLITDGGMKKEYLAAVHGSSDGGILEDNLFFDKRKNKSFVVKKDTERKGVKKAVLEYETLKTVPHLTGDVSLVKIKLMTGRTHQIRVQMSNAGHPLLGDGKYGGRDNKCECALWSFRIGFDTDKLKKTRLGKSDFARMAESSPDTFTFLPEGYPWDLFN
jgi:23S rRNA pseudouridine1911/1915/1917 synthase